MNIKGTTGGEIVTKHVSDKTGTQDTVSILWWHV